MTREEIRVAWVAALRSGKYKQGKNRLHTIKDGKHTYCCLGVLCEIIEGVEKTECDGIVSYNGSSFSLPSPVNDQVGLYGQFGHFATPLDDYEGLACMNDGTVLSDELTLRPKSFAEIADVIEQYPHLVFTDVDPPSLDASFESIA